MLIAAHALSDDGPDARDSYSSKVHVVSGWHTRSILVEADLDMYSNCELQLERGVHVRSEVAVGATDSNSPTLHTCSAAHCRSDVAEGITKQYSTFEQAVRLEHAKSDVGVAARDA